MGGGWLDEQPHNNHDDPLSRRRHRETRRGAEALTEQRRLSRIANTAGLPISTVHRILQELVRTGGYAKVRSTTTSRAGTDPARRPRRRRLRPRPGARPALRALCERSGYTVHFGVRQGDEAVYIDKLEGRGAYGMRSRIGATLPLHCTAIGKAILAAMPDDEVRRICSRSGLPRRMPHTLITPDALLANLASVRARGWAWTTRRT
jgi:Transcriptional regulator